MYQTNPTAPFPQTYIAPAVPEYERNVSEAVSGPSLGMAHTSVDVAIERVQKAFLDLTDTADRTFGPAAKAMSNGSKDVPRPSGTLPGLLQKLEWLHAAIADVEVVAQQFRSL